MKTQKGIFSVLRVIDKKITVNEHINDNLDQQLMLLYDYWFTQFNFPDNDGNLYQTSGGKVVWNDTLKRNIPENWKVQSVISNCLSSIIKPGVEIFNTKTYLATADVKGTSISTGTIVDYDRRESRANMQPSIKLYDKCFRLDKYYLCGGCLNSHGYYCSPANKTKQPYGEV